MNVNDLPENLYYRGLNNRFHHRESLLRKIGFTYKHLADGVAIFELTKFTRTYRIQASTVMHSDKRVAERTPIHSLSLRCRMNRTYRHWRKILILAVLTYAALFM